MLGKIQKDLLKLLAFFGGLFLLIYLGFFLLLRSSTPSWLTAEYNEHLLSYEKEMQFGEIIDRYAIKGQEIDILKKQTNRLCYVGNFFQIKKANPHFRVRL